MEREAVFHISRALEGALLSLAFNEGADVVCGLDHRAQVRGRLLHKDQLVPRDSFEVGCDILVFGALTPVPLRVGEVREVVAGVATRLDRRQLAELGLAVIRGRARRHAHDEPSKIREIAVLGANLADESHDTLNCMHAPI